MKELMLLFILGVSSLALMQETPMRAVALDPPLYELDSEDVEIYVEELCKTGANTVALTAGRVDWTYFLWEGHEENWSNGLDDGERDLVAETLDVLQNCEGIEHTSLVVDVFAPRYLERNPQAAALTADGTRLEYQVSTVELADGAFGQELLAMLEYLAKTYPVNSISLTELFYHEEGYGPDDLQSYKAFSGQDDWPRDAAGNIDINAPSVGAWRSALVARFVAQAAKVVQAHGKELIVDVRVPWGDLDNLGRKFGQDYDLLLEHADRLVLWVYLGLEDRNVYSADYVQDIAAAYEEYGAERVILSFGLWGQDDGVLAPLDLAEALEQAQRSKLPGVWVTPSSLMTEEHWDVLEAQWSR